jgi:hypothetical protein
LADGLLPLSDREPSGIDPNFLSESNFPSSFTNEIFLFWSNIQHTIGLVHTGDAEDCHVEITSVRITKSKSKDNIAVDNAAT